MRTASSYLREPLADVVAASRSGDFTGRLSVSLWPCAECGRSWEPPESWYLILQDGHLVGVCPLHVAGRLRQDEPQRAQNDPHDDLTAG